MFGIGEQIERIDPQTWEEACSNDIVRQHSNRYIWARDKIGEPLTVVDVACGAGYGTQYLAEVVVDAIGVDISKEAIEHAEKYFSSWNTIYICADATKETFIAEDVVVCFETIEHIEDDIGFIKTIASWLVEDGQLLISAPNENVIPLKDNRNPYHLRHYTPDSLKAIIEPYFEIIEVKFQNKEGSFKDDEDMIVVMQCRKRVKE
jgi:2-polyprenyl-3-methyl-5-hydroxy-6-metoxy-1,4-benzoquinol methylase